MVLCFFFATPQKRYHDHEKSVVSVVLVCSMSYESYGVSKYPTDEIGTTQMFSGWLNHRRSSVTRTTHCPKAGHECTLWECTNPWKCPFGCRAGQTDWCQELPQEFRENSTFSEVSCIVPSDFVALLDPCRSTEIRSDPAASPNVPRRGRSFCTPFGGLEAMRHLVKPMEHGNTWRKPEKHTFLH